MHLRPGALLEISLVSRVTMHAHIPAKRSKRRGRERRRIRTIVVYQIPLRSPPLSTTPCIWLHGLSLTERAGIPWNANGPSLNIASGNFAIRRSRSCRYRKFVRLPSRELVHYNVRTRDRRQVSSSSSVIPCCTSACPRPSGPCCSFWRRKAQR